PVFARKFEMHDRGRRKAIGEVGLVKDSTPPRAHGALHFGGIVDGKNAEGGVENMAGHIAEGACAELEPSSPVEGEVCWIEINMLRGPQPQVPIELFRNFVFA